MKTTILRPSQTDKNSFINFEEFHKQHRDFGYILLEEVCVSLGRKLTEIKELLPELPHIRLEYNRKEYIYIYKTYVSRLMKIDFYWQRPTFIQRNLLKLFWQAIRNSNEMKRRLSMEQLYVLNRLFKYNNSFGQIKALLKTDRDHLQQVFRQSTTILAKMANNIRAFVRRYEGLDRENEKLQAENNRLKELLRANKIKDEADRKSVV
jgi:hypothetical protein